MSEDGAGKHDGEWFEEWFRSDFYLKLYSHRDKAEAEACVELILRSTGIDPSARPAPAALDLACGPGRHAITLAERGFDVTAVDLSPTLLDYARSEAAEAGVAIDFVRSDMRNVEYHDRFDLAVQLFTSFGYFESHDDDRLVLDRVRESLHMGGFYALDLLNERYLRKSLLVASTKSFEGHDIHEYRWIGGDRVFKRIDIPIGSTMQVYTESVRLYSRDAIERLLRASRLEPVAWYGDYAGSTYDEEESPRMFIVSRAI